MWKKCAGPAEPGNTGEVRRDQTAVRRNGISGGELDALMDKAAEAGSDAVHQALADSGVYQAMAQKITHFIISLIACIVTYVVVYLVLHII